MNRMDILSRLVSIKSNAYGRAYAEIHESPSSYFYKIIAINLESGINQLIMEIQNSLLADCQSDNITKTSSPLPRTDR
ncbi:MAG: hypothetical protein ABFC94_16575 [Syntrophomonas sp.]